MVTVLKPGATEEQIENLCNWFTARGLDVHISRGHYQTIIGLIGDTKKVDTELLESLEIDKEKYIKDRLERLNWFNRLIQFEKDNHLTREIVDAFIERVNLSGDNQIEICYKFSNVFKDIISNGGVCIG